MKIIGLTGGIGSGKTRVLQLFIDKGVPVYIADVEAKKLMQSNPEIKKNIQAEFGKKSYNKGKLNTAYLAEIVFQDKQKLRRLNSIVHPVVYQDFLQFVSRQKAPFIIYENAILFENGSNKWCDYIITVTAPLGTRVQRVIARDKVTAKQVQDRIVNQWDDSKKIQASDFVIVNIDWNATKDKVEALYSQLLELSNL